MTTDRCHDHGARGCDMCAADEVRLAEALLALERALPLEPAPRDLRDAVLAARPARARRRGSRRRVARRWVSRPRLLAAAPAVGLAACCLVLVGMLDARTRELRSIQGQMVSLEGRPNLPVLKGASISSFDIDAPFGDARAQVALQDDAGVVVIRNAPAPPAGMAWQVWQVDEDDRIRSLGVITGAKETLFLPLADIDRDELRRIIITTEPEGGSVEPSEGDVVAESPI